MKYLILLLICVSCSQVNRERLVVYEGLNKCLEKYGARKPNEFERLVDSTGQALGTVVSYTLATGTAMAEYTVKLVIGVGGTLVICSPALALEVAAKGDLKGELGGRCLVYVGGGFSETLSPIDNMTKSVFRKTAGMRCPNVDNISEDIRKLAQCYDKKGEKQLAHRQINSIKQDKEFFQCLSDKEKEEVNKELSRLI